MGLKTGKLLYVFLSGLTLFLGTFFNLSLLPLTIFLGMFFLFEKYTQKKMRPKELIKSGLIFSLGFILLPLILYFLFHFDFIQTVRNIRSNVYGIHARSYNIWIFYNLYDFLIFSGIPIAIVFLLSLKKYFQTVYLSHF
jgi:hypothetical protein